MTDYHPLIARAVEGLDNEHRRSSPGSVRTGPHARWSHSCAPSNRRCSESDITKERLALEDAIRKVEAEAARNSRTELREPRPPPPRRRVSARSRPQTRHEARRGETRRTRAGPADDARRSRCAAPRDSPPSARERLLGARSSSRAAGRHQGLPRRRERSPRSRRRHGQSGAIGPRHAQFLWTGRAAPPCRRPKKPSDSRTRFRAGTRRGEFDRSAHERSRERPRTRPPSEHEDTGRRDPARHPPHAATRR